MGDPPACTIGDAASSRHVPQAMEVLDFRRTDAAWQSLLQEWTELSREASTFASPEFFQLQLTLAPPGATPILATAHDGERLRCALPLLRRGRALVPLRSDHSHLYDVLGPATAMKALVRSMVGTRSWDVLRLEEVPETSALATRLVSDARGIGCHVVVRPGGKCPVFALPSFEAHLKTKHRTNLRRCAKKAETLEYERITVADEAALAEGLKIEGLAWKDEAGTAIAGDKTLRTAYERLAHLAAARGELSLSFIRIGGRRVGFLFAIEHGGTLHAMKIGYDPAVAHLSPGHLLTWCVAQDAERRGLKTFDFMGKVDEWKSRWTEETRNQVTILVYRPTLRGVVEFTLREIIKPHTPQSIQSLAHRLAHEGHRLQGLHGAKATGAGLR